MIRHRKSRIGRPSERLFYQKITDIYATSVDYDLTAQATKRFFATVQNKLHWAIHGQTAAEVIVDRADATLGRVHHDGHPIQRQVSGSCAQPRQIRFSGVSQRG